MGLIQRWREWERRERQRMRWAQITQEGRTSSSEFWTAHAEYGVVTRLLPFVLVLLGFAAGLPNFALLGIGVVAIIGTLAWSWRKESILKKQAEAQFQAWLKRQGNDSGSN